MLPTYILGCLLAQDIFNFVLLIQDAFIEWEESTEPGEQEGKGVALKSCTQFFHWLKTAEPEDDEEELKVGRHMNLTVTEHAVQVNTTVGEEAKEEEAVTKVDVQSSDPVEDIGDKVVEDVQGGG